MYICSVDNMTLFFLLSISIVYFVKIVCMCVYGYLFSSFMDLTILEYEYLIDFTRC